MLVELSLKHIGSLSEAQLAFAPRLNLLTGDNGLGKSFLLDVIWWSLTRRWPAEVNPALTSGRKVRPLPELAAKAAIDFQVTGRTGRNVAYKTAYRNREESWVGKAGRPINPGLVLYAMADGSFAVWDPARNYWITKANTDIQERQPAYVFTPAQVWDGLTHADGAVLCNGLIRDWASWQKEKGLAFGLLERVLEALSPSTDEIIRSGPLTRVSLDDSRDIPTIKMPYGQDVPVVYASAGMKRIIALAYFLIWAWQEHQQAAQLLGESSTQQVTLLVDEVESHLHPSWQRSIVPALLSVVRELSRDTSVQVIAATHSPLVMASVETLFNPAEDRWFDFHLNQNEVVIRQPVYTRFGEVSNWLVSDAFGLQSARSIASEQVLKEAETLLLSAVEPDAAQLAALDTKLRNVLGELDPFWLRWRYICEKKGWSGKTNAKIG